MTRRFSVRTTPRFERLLRSLEKRHRDIPDLLATALRVLEVDPYNVSRQHNVRKLEGVGEGEGQYRLTLGRWRFRYDIVKQDVVLHYCGLRREDTYR